MHPYITRMKQELDKNPPSYGYAQADSLLSMLYMWYSEWNPIDSDLIRQGFYELEPYLCTRSGKTYDEIMDMISQLCVEHERVAFLEGVRVGVRLASEL